jgi:hypothetical protein
MNFIGGPKTDYTLFVHRPLAYQHTPFKRSTGDWYEGFLSYSAGPSSEARPSHLNGSFQIQLYSSNLSLLTTQQEVCFDGRSHD